MKSKIVISALLFIVININQCLFAQQEVETKTFTGVITYFEDSGLGPHYSLDVYNAENDEYLSALVGYIYVEYLSNEFGENIVGGKVKVTYTLEEEFHALNFAKPDTKVTLPDDQEVLTVNGKFASCEIGDMGGYLDITLDDGEWMSFMTDFECPEGVKEGDDIVVYYETLQNIDVSSIEAIK